VVAAAQRDEESQTIIKQCLCFGLIFLDMAIHLFTCSNVALAELLAHLAERKVALDSEAWSLWWQTIIDLAVKGEIHNALVLIRESLPLFPAANNYAVR
jgi:hypothetical protein